MFLEQQISTSVGFLKDHATLLFQVLALAAQELSEPITNKHTGAQPIAAVTALGQSDDVTHWRQIVDKRIQSKTRRISKVRRPQKYTH